MRRRPPLASHECGPFFVARTHHRSSIHRRQRQAGAQTRRSRPGGDATTPPVGSPSVRRRLLDGELSVLADDWVVGIQADDLVVVPYRFVRLAQVAVQHRPVAEGLDVVRIEGDGPPRSPRPPGGARPARRGRTLSCSTPSGRPG